MTAPYYPPGGGSVMTFIRSRGQAAFRCDLVTDERRPPGTPVIVAIPVTAAT